MGVKADAHAPKATAMPKGPLAEELLNMWIKGQLKTAAVQRLAMKAGMQGTPDIKALGRVRTFRDIPTNHVPRNVETIWLAKGYGSNFLD